MNASYDNSAAVVVLPPVSGGRLKDKSLRAWLAQSDLRVESGRKELLSRIVGTLQLPYPKEGLAALRMWGQTGDRPTVWVAGADPVYLEPRLDHLCLYYLRRGELPSSDLRVLVDHLQTTLAAEQQIGFVRLGHCCYVRAEEALSTASVPAYVVDQKEPDDHLPAGEDAATYRTLLSEIEMSLHDHEVNERRMSEQKRPVNSMWLWGGGVAPELQARAQPPLFADNPLLLGYWHSASAMAKPWPGSIAKCIEASDAGFVAVAPSYESDPGFVEDSLRQLRAALRAKRFDHLTISFRDGLRADIRRAHALRIWRQDCQFLD